MPMLSRKNDVEAGTTPDGNGRPTVVAVPASVSPELSDRPRRRTFTARDKLRILAATDHAAETGGIGAILRREGIYSSTLCDWRRQRDAGTFGALTPVKRGPKTAEPNPLAAENASLRKNNDHLARCLARAEAIIAVQKKLADLLGIPMTPDGGVP
jgi:transposase